MGVRSTGGVWGSKYRKVPKSGIVGVGPDGGVGSVGGGGVRWWCMQVKIKEGPKIRDCSKTFFKKFWLWGWGPIVG